MQWKVRVADCGADVSSLFFSSLCSYARRFDWNEPLYQSYSFVHRGRSNFLHQIYIQRQRLVAEGTIASDFKSALSIIEMQG